MNKTLCLLLVLLCLGMTACGKENTQAPVEDGAAASAGEPVSSGETETKEEMPENFVEPTSVVEETTPDGGQVTFYLDAKGRPMYSIQEYPGGYYHEFTYYPSGGTKIWVNKTPDGGYYEKHYLDDAYEEDGVWHEGTIICAKDIAADGTETEFTYEYDENGNMVAKGRTSNGDYLENRYENGEQVFNYIEGPDGSRSETRYENGIQTFSSYQYADGSYSETYFENGEKTKDIYGFNTEGEDSYYVEECYENGILTKRINRDKDGDRTEEYDAEGKQVYSCLLYPDGSVLETHYEHGVKTCDISKQADGSFYEWQFEGGLNTKTVEGRYNEAGIRTHEKVNDMKNRIYEEYKRNDAGILTYYIRSGWTGGDAQEYFFDDTGALIKYAEGYNVTEDPAKLAEIAADLNLDTP